jgi:hypothetical protein
MGWLAKLFGTGGQAKPPPAAAAPVQMDRRSALEREFHWERPGMPALATSRGYNQAVSGESFYREALERIAGGQTTYGVTIHKAAELQASKYEGNPAIQVHIDGERVGSIPAEDAAELWGELLALAVDGRATAKANITAGSEGGDYSVKLSLARPLRVRRA